ncbi:MAG: hypothetical protein LBD13_07105 [Spirochaetaceae bacterium]|nr:hypothetical protein [Spirochaetaceae bacterium]
MNFVPSITLQFNSLFSGGFQRARENLAGLAGLGAAAAGLNQSLGQAQSALTGIDTALGGVDKP